MLVLGLTTSTPQIGVALGDQSGLRAGWSAVRGRHHAELVTPAITEVCAVAEVEPSDIGVVAVDTGPGLFTGLRVGVATAKAMAFALGVPVIAVSSLDLLAFGYRYVGRRVTATIDARRSELFVASYVAVPGGMQRVSEPRTASADEVAAGLVAEPGPHLLIGNGAQRYVEAFAGCDRVELADASFPSAVALVNLAHARAMREEWIRPEEVECTYLREPDAAINWDTRDGHVGPGGHVDDRRAAGPSDGADT
jgi:tRNA threonylcarbamoyladenosine biosynthesis protein TsaB